MSRRFTIASLMLLMVLAAARPAQAQARAQVQERNAVGGGLGYTYDMDSESFLQVQGLAWLPIRRFQRFYFTPLVLLPRFQFFQGGDNRWQIDIGGIWDIPVAENMMVRPYMGLGFGLTHVPEQTTPLINFETGFRIRKPSWTHQFKTGVTYSAGLDYDNTFVLHFAVLFGIGGGGR